MLETSVIYSESSKRVINVALLSWQEYQSARNRVVRACREFGTVGAMGECPIIMGVDDPYGIREWPLGDDPYRYLIVDDQYNNEKLITIELEEKDACSEEWLHAMVALLKTMPDWAISIVGLQKGHLLLFHDSIEMSGPAFLQCNSVQQLISAARRAIRRA